MPERQFKERRSNVSGITREAYIELHLRGDKEKVAGADYDMLLGIKDCVSKTIAELCQQCAMRPALCDKKYIKKVHPKIPLSLVGILGTIFLLVIGFDAGILHGRLLREIVEFFK